jgi:hypothetical protein
MPKKESKEGEEPLIENKHITMGLSTVISVAIFVIGITWTVSMLWNGDKDHEEKQDIKTDRIAKRDSIYYKRINSNIALLLKRTENDSIELKSLKSDTRTIKALTATIIRNQKVNSDTIINQILRLYSNNEYSQDEKKKLMATLIKLNQIKRINLME